MPMYEYGCMNCQSRFDRLRRMDQDDSGVTCPRCNSTQVERQLSVFAAHTRGTIANSSAPVSASTGTGGCCGACGTCGSRN